MSFFIGTLGNMFQITHGYRSAVSVVFVQSVKKLFDGYKAFAVKLQFVFPRSVTESV